MSMQHHNLPSQQHKSHCYSLYVYHHILPPPQHHALSLKDLQWLLCIKQTQQHLYLCLQHQSQQISSLIHNIFPVKQFPELYHSQSSYICGISCSMSLTQRSTQYIFFIRHRRTQQDILKQTIVTHSSLADLYDQWFFQNTKLDIEERLQQLKPHILQYRNRYIISIWQRIWHSVRQWFFF